MKEIRNSSGGRNGNVIATIGRLIEKHGMSSVIVLVLLYLGVRSIPSAAHSFDVFLDRMASTQEDIAESTDAVQAATLEIVDIERETKEFMQQVKVDHDIQQALAEDILDEVKKK